MAGYYCLSISKWFGTNAVMDDKADLPGKYLFAIVGLSDIGCTRNRHLPHILGTIPDGGA
jgi:hypothetical protein